MGEVCRHVGDHTDRVFPRQYLLNKGKKDNQVTLSSIATSTRQKCMPIEKGSVPQYAQQVVEYSIVR